MKNTPLCAQCAAHELNEWMNEKSSEMKEDLARAIRLELKYLSLAEGNCIVCNNSKISYGWLERILRVMNRYRIKPEVKKEFLQMFGFGVML